jgi:predicted dehydrogenase
MVQNPLAPHNGHELRLQKGGEDHVEKVEGTGTTYRYQLVAFADAVRTGKKLPTMGADSIHQMRLIDAVYRAAGLKVRGT